jgi:hypothetical protein
MQTGNPDPVEESTGTPIEDGMLKRGANALKRLASALKWGIRILAILIWRLPSKRILVVGLITIACFGAYVELLWPDTTGMGTPVIVASSDTRTQIPLEVSVADNDQDIILRFDLHHWLYQQWERIDIQRAEGWKNIELVVNGRSSKMLNNAAVNRMLVADSDQYAHLSYRR